MGQVVLSPAATGDDGYSWSSWFYASASNNVQLGVSSSLKSTGFFRFPSAAIPQGATITSAEFKVYAKYNETSSLDLRIYGNDADNAVAPTSVAEVNALTRTTAYKDWAAPSFTADQAYTVDITDAIQEVVSRDGWASGNALQVIVESVTSSDTATRWVKHYDAGYPAVLTIDYADPPNIQWKKLAWDVEVVKHSLATAENDFLVAPASGSFVKKTLAETKTILGINNDGSRLTRTIYQAFHGFAVGDVLKYASGVYAKAKADTAANAEVIGIVSEVPDVDYFVLLMNGIIAGLSGLTANSVHYLSSATAGALTTTEPTTAGHISKPLLIAISTTAGFFFNMRGVEVADPGDTGTIPIALGAAYARLAMNADGDASTWRASGASNSSRAMDAATSSPAGSATINIAAGANTVLVMQYFGGKFGIGFASRSGNQFNFCETSAGVWAVAGRLITFYEASGKQQEFAITSWGESALNGTWTRTGETAAGTGYFYILSW